MIVDKYPMSPESKQIFRDHWPTIAPASLGRGIHSDKGPEFQRHMRIIQAALIWAHYKNMDDTTKRRAERTLQWIEMQG